MCWLRCFEIGNVSHLQTFSRKNWYIFNIVKYVWNTSYPNLVLHCGWDHCFKACLSFKFWDTDRQFSSCLCWHLPVWHSLPLGTEQFCHRDPLDLNSLSLAYRPFLFHALSPAVLLEGPFHVTEWIWEVTAWISWVDQHMWHQRNSATLFSSWDCL